MNYYILPLRFTSPVHFGNTANGGYLDKVSLTISSDSFFSALCNELSHTESIQQLVQALDTGRLALSSLFPYHAKEDGTWDFYVPRPGMIATIDEDEALSFEELKRLSTAHKQVKSIQYIRASELYAGKATTVLSEPIFGELMMISKVNKRGSVSQPYTVGSYSFRNNTGLYVLIGAEDDELLDDIVEIITSLGYTGIGGKRSSGYGKFIVADDPIWISEETVYGLSDHPAEADDVALYTMLTRQAGNGSFMSMSVVAPKADEIKNIEGTYKIKKRSGFVYSESLVNDQKRNSYYVLAEGALLKHPLVGQVHELSIDGLDHVMYRNGKGLWLEVSR